MLKWTLSNPVPYEHCRSLPRPEASKAGSVPPSLGRHLVHPARGHDGRRGVLNSQPPKTTPTHHGEGHLLFLKIAVVRLLSCCCKSLLGHPFLCCYFLLLLFLVHDFLKRMRLVEGRGTLGERLFLMDQFIYLN